MKVIAASSLKDLSHRILLAAGADEVNADQVAQHLVSAKLVGVDTHGVWQLPGYITAIGNGDLLPKYKPSTQYCRAIFSRKAVANLLHRRTKVESTQNAALNHFNPSDAVAPPKRSARLCFPWQANRLPFLPE